jgi:hypothetical protein
MTIYVVLAWWDYEGSDIVKIFSNKKAAEKCLAAQGGKSQFGADRYSIEEYEVSEE